MIPTILGSLTFLRRRGAMEVVSPIWRKLWKEWELRLMVLLSLIFQIALIVFGNRRKYNPKIWIKVILWSAYLMADSVATIALGVLSNDLGDRYGDDGDHGSLDPNNELTAFWAPFLLLHLGGPDTITAYALEDNELWLRHTFGLLAQTIVTIYIFLMAWTGSRLSILAMLMILVGFLKYAERTWVLWSASSEQLRDSMLTSPEPGPNYAKFMDEFSLKQAEGFSVWTEDVIEAQDSVQISDTRGKSSIPDVNELRRASELLKRFKRLFVDLILSFHDRSFSQSSFEVMPSSEAFKVIEIELGFMYDLFYTKAKVAYTPAGFLRRLFCLSVTCLVLLLFSLAEKQKYNKVDIAITFLLLAVAIVLEIYALLIQLSSDQTDLWLSRNNSTSTFQTIKFLQLPKQPRWSNSMAQYSLLSVCLKEKPATFLKIQKLLHIDEKFEKVRYTTYEKVSESLRESIFKHIKKKFVELQGSSSTNEDVRVLCTCRGGRVLNKYSCSQLEWSTKEDYDQSILVWHIATQLCYYSDRIKAPESINSNCEMSKHMSRYMLYLLVRYPFLLPVGIGLIRFRDTCAEATRFFETRRSTLAREPNRFRESYKSQACEMLLEVNTQIPAKKVKGDGSKSVLFDACRLASELNKLTDMERKWKMLREIWVEILAYAANQCRGSPHAQQLRRGGELLTHVWLLMAHFGITEQFQISEGHARAKLIVK